MAGPAALLVSIGHQAGALRALRAVAAPHPPRSPPQPSHTETSGTGRSGPVRCSPGEEMEMREPGGAQKPEEERRAAGKSRKEGEESGDSSPPSPERLVRRGTLRETALCSKMSRLVEATSRLVQVEETLLLPLLQQHPLPLLPKYLGDEFEVLQDTVFTCAGSMYGVQLAL
ncbi:PREDICTED: leukemia-associated protein 7 [Haliaeetus leucocephalus]|uniref:leukemia-associated protein 7 n=1 Tax=Haliaeetus leucocephalus TaxID=52644 RepID=UPI00053CD42B|nr:PREDICTED: leukemia-associated protein 7 [Haliaeetus leucocephalus]